jgi:hypothetical protein
MELVQPHQVQLIVAAVVAGVARTNYLVLAALV